MRVEELRDELLRIERVPVVCDYEDPKVGKVHQITHRQIRAEQLDALIAAAREEEMERIRKAGIETDMLSDRYQQQRVVVIPASVFGAKESEK